MQSPIANPNPSSPLRSPKKKKRVAYVKQVTGRLKDTDLHVAAGRGDLEGVRRVLMEEEEVVGEVNEEEETAVMVAAEGGFVDVVVELMGRMDREGLMRTNMAGLDALHLASRGGHREIVQVLLDHDPALIKSCGPSNVTPLITAAAKGYTEIVKLLLDRDCRLIDISKSNGKNALHFAARYGHEETVKLLLERDPHLPRRTDKKGQTALHMAVKGTNCRVVKGLLEADPAIVMLPDRAGNTALHVATRKKRPEAVNILISLPDIHVNALTRDHKTAFDIAEELLPSEESADIKDCLSRNGAVRANELNQPRDELRKTVSDIKKNVHIQLEQTRKTNQNVHGIAKELRKLHREGINNATNSVTVVAVLFATVAFAAIFTVPGGNNNDGTAVAMGAPAFKIFFIFNAIALFTSLAVVVVQITLVRGETKSERRVVQVINKLMWLASVCTTVAFIASTYIVVGRHYVWAALLVTMIGGVIMAGVLGTMTYFVVKSKQARRIRKRDKLSKRSGSSTWQQNSDLDEPEVDKFYAI